ncbi:MAG: hypothetical protein HOL51_13085 [Gemmatimonadetes bacterium]|nr:hypothetical protein [Gemmatimonadota bacterium]MBT5327049.1 hypothetical protein [Gemmatimonadota bacterium]MBT5804999.1 hypothetical protein [Gemmatimonadota bacterium]MBT6620907.1 hypothetical protein [Gemmatimonadota bacterium]MBT7588532.1 hypothetical protein [Gemmatimonadota bacterium]
MEAAGIPKETAAGKLDFHACRLAYINFVLESGVSVKEAQELARHSTPELTFNVYGRTRKERLSETAEKVAANILPVADNAIFMPRQAVGAKQESATPFADRELHSSIMVEAAGIEPVEIKSTTDTTAPRFAANPSQNNALQHLPISTKQPDSTVPRQNHNDSQQQICVPGVYENSLPEDLVHVMACWSRLPNNLQRQILALLRHY